MLDYAAALFVFSNTLLCTLWKLFWAFVSQPRWACSFLMKVPGHTYVLCTIIKVIYVMGGGYNCASIACFLSYNFAMFLQCAVSSYTLSCVHFAERTLLRAPASICCDYVQIHIWRRDLVSFVSARELQDRRRYQAAARPWSAELHGFGFAHPAQSRTFEVALCMNIYYEKRQLWFSSLTTVCSSMQVMARVWLAGLMSPNWSRLRFLIIRITRIGSMTVTLAMLVASYGRRSSRILQARHDLIIFKEIAITVSSFVHVFGRKLFFAHEKKLHCPLVYYEFCARVCCYLKPLATDQTDELLSKAMGWRRAAQGTLIDPCTKDEHFKIGTAWRAVGELDRMIACNLLDGNLPPASWDFVGEHSFFRGNTSWVYQMNLIQWISIIRLLNRLPTLMPPSISFTRSTFHPSLALLVITASFCSYGVGRWRRRQRWWRHGPWPPCKSNCW